MTELAMGGAAKVVRDHAAAFRSFADVREVVFNRADGVDFDGDDIVSLDVGGGGGVLNRVANFARRVRRYSRFKDEWQPDISVAHLEGAHYVDVLSRRREKVVLVMHGSILQNHDIAGAVGTIRRKLLIPLALRRADAIVAVSRDIASELDKMGIGGARVFNNFFDVDRIERMAHEPLAEENESLFDGPPVIVTAGRLALQKNQAPFIEAFAKVRARRVARLIILGDGPLRQSLLDQAATLGLKVSSPWTQVAADADVHFLGVQSNPFAFIARSALFALPSGWEGFPLALCEAMACGTAVISADCPTGPREILSPESAIPPAPIRVQEPALFGVLMPIPERGTASLSLWAEELGSLVDDRDRRASLAAAGRRRVQDFTAEKIVPQWRALFDELLAATSNNRS